MNLLLAFIASFLWGTTYSVTQAYLSGWPPLLLGALRAFPAGLILLALRPVVPSIGVLVKLSVTGVINIGIFFICIFVMALTLPSAISSVGMMSVPVFAMLIQWILTRKKPSMLQIISGIGLILIAGLLFNPQSISLNPIGLVALLVAVLCIVTGSLLTQKMGMKTHWWSIVTWQLLAGGFILVLLSAGDAYIHPDEYLSVWNRLSSDNLSGLCWIILMNTAFAYSLYVWTLQKISLVEFTFSGVANPMAGILCGLVLLGESYSPFQYALMVGMIAMSLLPNIVKSLVARKSEGSLASKN
ncbi:DMT family transporter [Vibrio salinus]|uniref:DMT family transporter n=1 Tax=Vibrio salinus TaxID=2899784 RepID=UPI001E3CE44D|nr:EamA family transporter [Vibrio salinus]MCE0494421.1 EamA family transporter [Vibrio salinus]